jgi:hypothetical protein
MLVQQLEVPEFKAQYYQKKKKKRKKKEKKRGRGLMLGFRVQCIAL